MANKGFWGLIVALCFFGACAKKEGCLVGAFLADQPSALAINEFQKNYGKKPFLILTFLDWGKYPDQSVIRDIYGSGCIFVVTWEPWHAGQKKAIDYDAVLSGKDDAYIREFAVRLKAVEKPVLLRFGHEMNGDWYPWAGQKIGGQKYQQLFRHVRKIFDEVQAANVRWVFSINAENIPKGNAYHVCYPGDRYVDYIGLDGYNWGTTQAWSQWQSFKNIFSAVYAEVTRRYRKPVIISEFSSASAGGDKARWIDEALETMKKMPEVKGFILFNVDKEADWRFSPDGLSGQKLKEKLAPSYFKEAPQGNFS